MTLKEKSITVMTILSRFEQIIREQGREPILILMNKKYYKILEKEISDLGLLHGEYSSLKPIQWNGIKIIVYDKIPDIVVLDDRSWGDLMYALERN